MRVISTIVPAYQAENTLGACLKALLSQRLPDTIQHEIIVVDDGSIDGTPEIARRAGVTCVRTDKPASGPGAARNLGVEVSQGDPVLFTDADCVPISTWAAGLFQALQEEGVAGVKGAYRSNQREPIARFVQAEYSHKYERTKKYESINFIDTYSAGFRRKVFLENGGFNMALKRNQDQELSFRLARKGYRLVFVPEAVVYHQHNRTVTDYFRRKFRIGYWKAILLRWHPDRLVADTHTPPAQRLQIGFLFLAALGALLIPIEPLFLWIPVASLALLALTSLRELTYIARKDSDILWVAPFMILIRAVALGSGLAVGGVATDRRAEKGGWRPLSFWQRFIKRSMDLMISSIGLVLSLPVLSFARIAIKLDDGGPLFFRQTRVGEGGKPFMMLKLRTMVVDAEKLVQQVLDQNPLEGPVFKIPDDPRVTRVGRWLRRWSLDEIPQLWNVLKGEMSLVGPRPEEDWVVAQYDDEQRQRLAVKPGLTGPMQVSGRGALDMDERLALELDYIEDYSLGRDLKILLKTIPAVFKAEGAF